MRALALVISLALPLLVVGCPGDDGTNDGGNVPASTGAMATAADDSGGGPPLVPGTCAATCETVDDCGAAEDFQCNDGYCLFVGVIPPCVPEQCVGGVCSPVDGILTCTFPCTPEGDECDFLLEGGCNGMDDAGTMICGGPPCFGAEENAPCEIPSRGGAIGSCRNGECTCLSDAECTVDGEACNNGV